jgi:hypothetical protein
MKYRYFLLGNARCRATDGETLDSNTFLDPIVLRAFGSCPLLRLTGDKDITKKIDPRITNLRSAKGPQI